MNPIKIAEFNIRQRNGRDTRLAIIRCHEGTSNPKEVLNHVVSKYVSNVGYNEFIKIELNDPLTRLVVKDMDKLDYKKSCLPQYPDVETYETILFSNNQDESCKLAVLRGGLNSINPLSYMSEAVSEFSNRAEHHEFVEITLDNPWVRVLLFNEELIKFIPFQKQKINVNI